MKIYTKTGDDGKTSLFDNTRVWKSHDRIMSYGAVDELNSALGIILSMKIDSDLTEILSKIQNDLFIVGSDLANPDATNQEIRTTNDMILSLEAIIDKLESELPQLTSFILPGGVLASSMIHLARTIARRAETHVVSLSQNEKITRESFVYLNRLSDLLFIIARTINKRNNINDTIWKP